MTENLDQDSRFPSQDLNSGLKEYEGIRSSNQSAIAILDCPKPVFLKLNCFVGR
jgi:hypothetical protein